jgi:hypothetical protein
MVMYAVAGKMNESHTHFLGYPDVKNGKLVPWLLNVR